MDYKNFKIEDFLLDDAFIAWVKNNENDAFWQAFLEEYPKQKSIAEQAKNMILAAQIHLSLNQKEKLKNRIFEAIEAEEIVLEKNNNQRRSLYWIASIAASLALVITAYFFYFKHTPSKGNTTWVYQELLKKVDIPLIEVTNDSDKPKLIILSDKTSILLQKGSRLSYPQSFDNLDKRTVYLSGEAFFEVAKNPEKPFLVYANELVTKVLGTSFNVKAFSTDKDVIVTVKTGKVAVFSNTEIQKKEIILERNTEGVVLTPNQQITFNRTQAQLLKSLVKVPILQELPTIQKVSFDFDDTPISKVFDLLEKAYGVDIIYDEELLKSCKITASMTDEHLFEKLKLICLAIECEYQIIDAQIIIHSKGCK